MYKLTFKIFISLLISIALSACNSITRLTSLGHDSICLSAPLVQDGVFYASGSAATLEQAKSNARQDLVLQISSEVSSKVENKTTDINGNVRSRSSSVMQAKSAAIPIDQHKIIETCQAGHSTYVALTLKKQALISSTKVRLETTILESEKIYRRIKYATLYEKYIARQLINEKLTTINTYSNILLQYAGFQVNKKTRALTLRLEKYLEKSGRLVIGVQSSRGLKPLQNVLEQALNKSKLEYKQGSRRTVALIKLNARQDKQRLGKRYIIKLNASLDVIRSDTGKMLSSYDLGQAVGTSTISYKLALQGAQRTLQNRLKQHLNKDANKVIKILGLASNEI